MDPSSAPAESQAPDVSAASSPADPGVTPAAPPAAEPAPAPEPELTLVDALAEAVKKPDDAKPDADKPTAEKPADKAADKPADTPKQKTAEEQAAEDAKLPFGKHPRWKAVIGENQELRKFRETAAPQLEEYGRIREFMHRNEIAPEEMQGLYVLAAMLKHEPEKALATLRQMIEPLERFTGDRLPDDLQSDVDDGVITEERAKELARLRSTGKFREEQTQRQAERTQQDQVVALRRSQAQVVTDWEAKTRASDPDYPRYQEWVALELRRLHAEKPARTPEEALSYAQQAYSTVKAKFQATIGAAAPHVPRGPSAAHAPGSNGRQPAPATMLDAVRQAL